MNRGIKTGTIYILFIECPFVYGIRGDVMRAEIIEKQHAFYKSIFNVCFISGDAVAGVKTDSKDVISASINEVSFIYDSPWEEKVMANREILNIKKPKEASYYIYYVLLKSIEEHTGGKIEHIIVVDDVEDISKNIWNKRIKAVISGHPIQIDIAGKKYENTFDIRINDMNKDVLLEECQNEIEKLKIGLDLYTKRLNGLMYTIQSLKNDEMYTCTPKIYDK